MICPNCGEKIPDNSLVCPVCSVSVKKQPEPETPVQEEPQTAVAKGPALPMKWHKFLVSFALWVEILFLIIAAFLTVIITALSTDPDTVAFYSEYPGVKAINLIYGISLLGCAVLGGFALYCLLKMKKGAPRLYIWFLVAAASCSVIYQLLEVIILRLPLFSTEVSYYVTSSGGEGVQVRFSSPVFAFIIFAVYILLNYIYYRKRKHMFIY